MATRLYLPSTGAAAISPAYSASWEDTAQAGSRLAAVTSKISSAMSTKSISDAISTDADILIQQWVSAPLVTQTIAAQVVDHSIKVSETNNGNQLFRRTIIRVAKPDGTYRGTLVAFQTDDVECTTTLSSKYDSSTSSALNVFNGDRIVIEFGLGGDPTGTNTHNGSMIIGDNSASDLPGSDGDTNTFNPWVNFANTITFGSALTTTSSSTTTSTSSTTTSTTSTSTSSTSSSSTTTQVFYLSWNNYEFVDASSENTGIISVTEKIR